MKNFNNQSRRPHTKPQRQQTYEQHQSRPYNDHNGYHKAENSTRSFSRKENSDVNFHAPHKRNFDKFNNNNIKNVHKPQRNEQSQSNSRSQSRDTHYHSKQKQKYEGNSKNLSTKNQESHHKKPSPVKPFSGSAKAESHRIGITHSLTGLRQEEGLDAVNKENGSSRQIQMSQKIQAKLTQKVQDLQKKTEEEKLQPSTNIKAAGNSELREKEVEGQGKRINLKETQISEESEDLEIDSRNRISSPPLTDSLKTGSESTSLLEKRSKIGDETDGDFIDDEIKQIEADAQVSKKLKTDSKKGVIVTRRETAEKIPESLKALSALIEETSKRLSPQQKQNLMEIENNKEEKPLSQRLFTVLNFFDNFNINK